MKNFLILGVLIASITATAADKKATKAKQGLRKPSSIECPVSSDVDDYQDKVATAIKATENCGKAKEMAESCAFSSSVDMQIAVTAERKCGLDFWKKLSKTDIEHYNSLQGKCSEKYKDMEGTMYISAAAFCRLNVAALYSELYTPGQ